LIVTYTIHEKDSQNFEARKLPTLPLVDYEPPLTIPQKQKKPTIVPIISINKFKKKNKLKYFENNKLHIFD
jgi:hypothetical protein